MERAEVVSGAIAGSLTAALSLTGDPALVVLGGAGAVPLQFLLSRAAAAAGGLLDRAADSGGPESLLQHLRCRPAATALLLDAAEAIARTEYEEKVEAIARAISSGVLYEQDVRFDTEAVIIRTVIALERPHVAVLIGIGGGYVYEEHLAQALPGYSFILPALLSELQRLGLTRDLHDDGDGDYNVGGAWATGLGREVQGRFLAVAGPDRIPDA